MVAAKRLVNKTQIVVVAVHNIYLDDEQKQRCVAFTSTTILHSIHCIHYLTSPVAQSTTTDESVALATTGAVGPVHGLGFHIGSWKTSLRKPSCRHSLIGKDTASGCKQVAYI
jgi:hypothetical protein